MLNDMADNNLVQQPDARQSSIQFFAFVIAAGVCMLLSVGFMVSSYSRPGQSCEIELDERINPNHASVASLVRLPGIGVGRTGAIAAYREDFKEEHGNNPAFRNCDDLQKVKGIGPKTVQNISRWLKFK